MNVEEVAIDDLSAEILQELRPVVFAMRQRPDRVALFEELPGGSATGGAGRPGDENHGFRHRSPSFERCSLLTQQHYACIWIYVRRRKAPRSGPTTAQFEPTAITKRDAECFVSLVCFSEQRLVLGDVVRHREWLLAGEFFHQIATSLMS